MHILFRAPASEGLSATPMLFKRVFGDLDVPDPQAGRIVSPGGYEIITAPGHFRASLPAINGSPARSVDLDLTDNNQELDMSSGEALASLTTTIQISGDAAFPIPLFISLRDAKGRRASTSLADPKSGANFNDLRPGKYSISAFGDQPYAIANVTSIGPAGARGKTTSSNIVDLPAGSNLSFALTLIGGSSRVEGFVQRDGKPFDGAMVVLVPAHPDAHLEFFRRDQSDLDGSFALPNVVPGTYTAVAIEDGWDLDWSTPSVIARYATRGQKLTVPASTKSFHLPAPLELQPK